MAPLSLADAREHALAHGWADDLRERLSRHVSSGQVLAVSLREAPRFGPLAGVAVLVKDNIETAEMPTTAGSLALSDVPTGRDAAIVTLLRAAGAFVVGKANLSEWANFRGAHSISGWSARGGLCRNPHDPSRSAGGSSSGSAAAVALGLVPVAVGTETDGSVLCPASLCGVAGYKSTPDVLPRDGVIPLSTTQDSVGLFAASAVDLLEVASVLVPTTTELAPRLVIPERLLAMVQPATASVFLAAIEELRARDVATSTVEGGEGLVPDADDEMMVLLFECGRELDAYLRARHEPEVDSLDALIARNEKLADRELALFGQELLEQAASPGFSEEEYLAARDRNLRRTRAALDALLGAGGVIALPTMDPAWPIDLVHGDPPIAAPYSAAAVAGYPAVHLPLGHIGGLPVGMTLVGPACSDRALLALAATLERRLQGQRR